MRTPGIAGYMSKNGEDHVLKILMLDRPDYCRLLGGVSLVGSGNRSPAVRRQLAESAAGRESGSGHDKM